MPSPISMVNLARDFRRSVANRKSGSIRGGPRNQQARRDQLSNPVRAQRLRRVGTGRRLPLALFAFVFSAASALGQTGDSATLRGMVQAEKDAGRLSGYHIAETFGAVGATTSRSATHGDRENEPRAARAWAEAFCASATRNFPVEPSLEAGRLHAGSAASFPLVPDSDADERSPEIFRRPCYP